MDSNSYPYSALSGDEIRYLTVHPFDESIGVVQCTLHHASLQSLDGIFTALSYVWGDASVTETVQLTGHPFNVTTNLAACLRQFATNPKQHESCLWVDAICINQDDIDERNIQVQRMKDIYSSAESTISWLGPSTRLSDIGMQLIQRCDQSEVEDICSTLPFDMNQFNRAWKKILQDERDAGLSEMLKRPYWHRTWIIQELVLSRRVRLVCGDREVAYEKLKALVSLCSDSFFHLKYATMDLSRALTLLAREITIYGLLAINYIIETRNQRFIQHLQDSRDFECSDARDKIYALLGVGSVSDAGHIVPDYNRPVAKVYGDVAEMHIRTHDDLEILSYSRYQNNDDTSCASWIPDWRDSGPRHFLAYPSLGERYYASKKLRLSSHPWLLDRATEKLHLTGACLDTVTTLGTIMKIGWDPNKIDESVVDAAKSCMQLCLHTLAQGHLDTDFPTPYNFQGLGALTYPLNDNEPLEQACKRTLVADYDVAASQVSQRSPFMMLLPGDEAQHRLDGSAYTHHDTGFSCTAALDNRRLAFTSKGWMGLVPKETEVGDCVALLIGANMPFILRRAPMDDNTLALDEQGLGETTKAEDEFLLIGQAYVHGLMHGRGLELAELGRITLR